ncbi:telomere repeat-binding protein [Salix suchowensis]|nr:telomere repeat-binding protein [Salix suchowensis]
MDEMDQVPHFPKNFANVKCQRVKVDDSFNPSLEDKTIGVHNLIAEPKTDHVSVDIVLCFANENSSKRSEIDAFFSNGFDYLINPGFPLVHPSLKSIFQETFSSMHSKHVSAFSQGPDDLELGVLDGFLDEVDEVDDIHEADDFSGAYEDFLLDIELAEKVSHLDYAPREGSQVRNSSSESQSPGCSGSGNAAVGMPESSMATVPASESKNGPLQKTKRCKKSNDRRKHQRMWTTTEVMKLIDGIAPYGRSSCSHQLPTERPLFPIKEDKWRNLLRASGAQKRKSNKKEVLPDWLCGPPNLLRRVVPAPLHLISWMKILHWILNSNEDELEESNISSICPKL